MSQIFREIYSGERNFTFQDFVIAFLEAIIANGTVWLPNRVLEFVLAKPITTLTQLRTHIETITLARPTYAIDHFIFDLTTQECVWTCGRTQGAPSATVIRLRQKNNTWEVEIESYKPEFALSRRKAAERKPICLLLQSKYRN